MCYLNKQSENLHTNHQSRWIARSITVFQQSRSYQVRWLNLSAVRTLTWWKVAGLLILFGVAFIQLIKVLNLDHHA
ncbi:hypothetical protein SPFL3102_01876 [Sporomusaceae bacterium FL31]|nr:hypothetical protein SPFL3101_03510 [Sporomusaceae bacterium FL31]GCE34067.1 hypothetical protein SPFL3102_01876 [Sporomusaceae bacterium]